MSIELEWYPSETVADTYQALFAFSLKVTKVGDAYVWGVFGNVFYGARRICPPPEDCMATTLEEAQSAALDWSRNHIQVRTDE